MTAPGASTAPAGAVLVVLDAVPLPLTEGDRLRAFHLARGLSTVLPCLLAVPADATAHLDELRRHGPFSDVLLLPEVRGRGRPRRLLRTDNGWYLRRGWPAWFERTRRALQTFVDAHAVHTVVAGKLPVAELVAALGGVRRVLDDFDCYTLTLERELALHRERLSLRERLAKHIALQRYRRQESRLHRHFDAVTTISPADARRLAGLCPAARVSIVPNGVDDRLLAGSPPASPAAGAAGVAFWGNLAFEPNRSAVRYFIERVYAPFLAEHALPCLIIGAGADDWIRGLPQRFPAVRVTGFVDDLAGLVSTVPVMVNPMVSGSGLKNKMLEAFALGRAVVSTTMGSEAIDADAGLHFRLADTPADFAHAVLELCRRPRLAAGMGQRARSLVRERYTWAQIEARWRAVVLPRAGGAADPAVGMDDAPAMGKVTRL